MLGMCFSFGILPEVRISLGVMKGRRRHWCKVLNGNYGQGGVNWGWGGEGRLEDGNWEG